MGIISDALYVWRARDGRYFIKHPKPINGDRINPHLPKKTYIQDLKPIDDENGSGTLDGLIIGYEVGRHWK